MTAGFACKRTAQYAPMPVIPGQWKTFADRHLNVSSVAGSEYLCVCPFHADRNASFQFNIDSGLYVCFAGRCGVRGNIFTLASHFGVQIGVRAQGNDAVLEEALSILRDHEKRQRILDKYLPETTMSDDMLLTYKMPTDYWDSRGFDPETVEKFELGYDFMANAATIPMRTTSGGLIGLTRRFLDDDAPVRYMYPRGFKKRLNLFGSWLLEEDDDSTVVLTEGAIDTMKVWQAGFAALAQYGSRLSQEQVNIMRRGGVQTVVLFYDNDGAGRKATRTVVGMEGSQIDLREFFVVRKASYSGLSRSSFSDPGSMDDDQIRDCVRRSTLLV